MEAQMSTSAKGDVSADLAMDVDGAAIAVEEGSVAQQDDVSSPKDDLGDLCSSSPVEHDFRDICSSTPDREPQAIPDQRTLEEKLRDREEEANRVWKEVNDSFLKKLDVDPALIQNWMPRGIDMSWSARSLNAMSISCQFVEAQRDDLVTTRDNEMAHFKRHIHIRLDLDRALSAVKRALKAQQKHTMIEDILRSQFSSKDSVLVENN